MLRRHCFFLCEKQDFICVHCCIVYHVFPFSFRYVIWWCSSCCYYFFNCNCSSCCWCSSCCYCSLCCQYASYCYRCSSWCRSLILLVLIFFGVDSYHVASAHRANVHHVVANVSHVVVGVHHIVGHCFARTITLDPTFGSFILLELISHWVNRFLWWKCLDCLDWNEFFWAFRVWTK